jgi:hypothetical protein
MARIPVMWGEYPANGSNAYPEGGTRPAFHHPSVFLEAALRNGVKGAFGWSVHAQEGYGTIPLTASRDFVLAHREHVEPALA